MPDDSGEHKKDFLTRPMVNIKEPYQVYHSDVWMFEWAGTQDSTKWSPKKRATSA